MVAMDVLDRPAMVTDPSLVSGPEPKSGGPFLAGMGRVRENVT